VCRISIICKVGPKAKKATMCRSSKVREREKRCFETKVSEREEKETHSTLNEASLLRELDCKTCFEKRCWLDQCDI
jgi:hypothetical protein